MRMQQKERLIRVSSHQSVIRISWSIGRWFLSWWVVLLLRKYIKVPRALEGAKSILLMPLLGVALTGFAMLAVNIPMAINTGLNNFLSSLSGGSAVLLGLLVGWYDGSGYGWDQSIKQLMFLLQVLFKE